MKIHSFKIIEAEHSFKITSNNNDADPLRYVFIRKLLNESHNNAFEPVWDRFNDNYTTDKGEMCNNTIRVKGKRAEP